ncbi:DUF2510 domain-containing protein [Gordonia sp. TBRC 11910]|uniref:DUF2510 domain-containing protein n=2 Tax=Gordonia asplenii TaxID=2725283 RepID=A0A848L088_9ACTN|nr:DUF2510 domain-containing protein [Gordonia asplenii]
MLVVLVALVASVVVVVLLVRSRGQSQSQPTPATYPATPPGWYPAPDDPRLLRWFDGRQWTEHTQPRSQG